MLTIIGIIISKIQDNIKIYHVKVNTNLNEITNAMAFYVQKLIIEEKEKDKIRLNPEDLNNFIRNNEAVKDLDKKVINNLGKLEDLLKKRNIISDFNHNNTKFLNYFENKQQYLMKAVKIQKNLYLKKKYYNENEFIDDIMENYTNLYKKELENYILNYKN